MSKVLSVLKDKIDKENITHKDCTDISEAVIVDIRSKENLEKFEAKGKIIEDYLVAIWFNNNEDLWENDISQETKDYRKNNKTVQEEHVETIENLLNNNIDIESAQNELPQPSEEVLLKSMQAIKERFDAFEEDLPEPAGKKEKED